MEIYNYDIVTFIRTYSVETLFPDSICDPLFPDSICATVSRFHLWPTVSGFHLWPTDVHSLMKHSKATSYVLCITSGIGVHVRYFMSVQFIWLLYTSSCTAQKYQCLHHDHIKDSQQSNTDEQSMARGE